MKGKVTIWGVLSSSALWVIKVEQSKNLMKEARNLHKFLNSKFNFEHYCKHLPAVFATTEQRYIRDYRWLTDGGWQRREPCETASSC